MLTTGKPGNAVWMTIDDEVVAGRLEEIRSGVDEYGDPWTCVWVRYSEQSRGDVRGCFPESVFAENDYEAAKRRAKGKAT